jgi:Phosphotyrosyl phosphate activator (PTPA) protein
MKYLLSLLHSGLVILHFEHGANAWKRFEFCICFVGVIKFISDQQVDTLCAALLPTDFSPVIPHIKPYLLTSFGSFTRMDYGTGHEVSFALFLLCLTLTRFLLPVPDEERDIVLRVFVRYFRLCWRLQDVYQLEPAGSHGVWGLDDYAFLGYIFGSGQLRGIIHSCPCMAFHSQASLCRPRTDHSLIHPPSAVTSKQSLFHVYISDTSS